MPRRLLWTLVILLLALSALPAGAQSRSVFWERWDVLIDNVDTATNRFDVTESYQIDFSGTFQFGSAVIPYANVENITGVRVYQGGEALRESCSGQRGTYCAERTSDGLSITYNFFQPISDSSEQFEIRYTVVGGLRSYEGGDQLWWTAVPSDHYGFSIGRSTVRVELPQGYAPREGIDPVETYGAAARVNVQGTMVTAESLGRLGGDDYFEIRVQYPHNPNARRAAWQTDFDQQRLYEERTQPLVNIGLIALSLLLLIGGLMGVYALWYSRGRDPKVGPVPEYLSEPPDNLPPAMVGTLLDEQADLRDIISTLIDLARRGYLVMEESQEAGFFGIGFKREFTFKRTDKPLDDLRSFERGFIKYFFSNRMERSLESLRNTFYSAIPRLQHELYEAIVAEGLFSSSPQSVRSMWQGLGLVLIVLAFFGTFAGAGLVESIGGALICIPFSLGTVGVAALMVGRHMPAKTRKGAEDAAKWNAFREYIRNLDKYSDVQEAVQHFDDYLAYAIAFGVDRAWLRRFSEVTNVPVPPWYWPTYRGGHWGRGYTAGSPWPGQAGGSGLPGELARAGDGGFSLDDVSGDIAGGLESISSGLSNMLESASRAMTSRPQQTSGSSGRWSSGGRSWSGGGFGGGGSSGGGSRGFG